jgi:regulatory protein
MNSNHRGAPAGFKKRQASNSETGEAPRKLSPERQEQRARNVLLYQLARGAKSAHTLRQILEKREIDREIAESVIERFIEVGLIDDVSYAETVVNSRQKFKGLAKSAIKRELSQKGVEAAIVEQVTDSITVEDEFAMALELANKRIVRMANLEYSVRQRRLNSYLARKGYSSSIVIAAVKQAEQGLDSTS